MGARRVALAFSGGLDTSFCVAWLREEGWEVVTVAIDTGGFSALERDQLAARSRALGAVEHVCHDARAQLFDRYLRYLIFANALRGGTYPLSVSAERVCQAEQVVAAARQLGAQALAHGSTGAGNDQVRFDVAFATLAPEMELLAPIRSLGWSRSQEAGFLRERGFPVDTKTEQYSINAGLWGTSVGGKETLGSWEPLPDEAYPGGPASAREPEELRLAFEQGVPAAIDARALEPVALLGELAARGGRFAIGRGIHLGDTILGIKGRVGFHAPAAYLAIHAHRELEKLVLSGKQLFWKETLGNLYGSLLHEGQFFDPLARDLEAFLASSQQVVSGEVRLRLKPGCFDVLGVRAAASMMDRRVASYGEANRLWNGAEAAGFAKLYGVQQQLARRARAAEEG